MCCTEYLLIDFWRHARRLERWREMCKGMAAHVEDVEHTANEEATVRGL